MKKVDMRRTGEDGAVAITAALVLVILILLASFLVDLGTTRADARTNQSLADTAVMAGALTEGSAIDQCKSAVAFFAANIDAGAVDDTPCDALPVTCSEVPPPGTAPKSTAPIVVGAYTLVITHPVDDTDPAMSVQSIDSAHDAEKCDRFKVEVWRTNDYTFGSAAGLGGQGQSIADAVAIRHQEGEPDIFASLIVLEREACKALDATGGANIQVIQGDPYDHDSDPATPDVTPLGTITVDTTADGGTGSEDCNTGGTQAIIGPASGFIEAADHIFSYGLAAGNAGNVYNPAHVPSRIRPEPEPGIAAGRRQIDWKFNCLPAYPDAAVGDNQRYPADEHKLSPPSYRHGPCAQTATRPPYVDELRAKLQSGSLTSEGFHETPTGGCPSDIVYDPGTSTLDYGGTVIPGVPPRLHVRCTFGPNFTLDLPGIEYVVFNDEIDKSPTLLRLHGKTDVGGVAYFRSSGPPSDGGMSIGGGTVDIEDVFVYVDSRGARNQDVPVNIGGNAALRWLAPVSSAIRATCAPYDTAYLDGDPLTMPGIPPAGCFAPLALWSNSEKEHGLTGSGGITVRGSFFTPNAVQKIAGGAGFNFVDSQFFASYLRTTGGGTIVLKPNPNTNVPIEPPSPALIR